jgi:transcriptional regulator with XRE-family HTH domain
VRPGRAASPFDAALGLRLAEARQAAQLSQDALAAVLDCTQAAISQWESGRRGMSAATAVECARVLHVRVRWLLTGSA